MENEAWRRDEGQYPPSFVPIEYRHESNLDVSGIKHEKEQRKGMIDSTSRAMTRVDGELYTIDDFERILAINAQSIGIDKEVLRQEALERLAKIKKQKQEENQK